MHKTILRLTYQERLDALRELKIKHAREKVKLAIILNNFKPESNHPKGGFYGPKAVGENFRRLLQVHPTYVEPLAS
jgi:hypothetical protein